jgi:hypothetical protein
MPHPVRLVIEPGARDALKAAGLRLEGERGGTFRGRMVLATSDRYVVLGDGSPRAIEIRRALVQAVLME